MTNIPEKIFIQTGFDHENDECSFSDLTEVTWCITNVHGNDIPYIHKDAAMYKAIDFGRWLSKNNWHYYEELDFFYQHDYDTNKGREETGLTLYEFFCWINDEINPFLQLSNGRYCQACGNSTTWSYDELLQLFKKEQNSKP